MPFWLQVTTTRISVFVTLWKGCRGSCCHSRAPELVETQVSKECARGGVTTLFGPWAELGSFENLNALLPAGHGTPSSLN